MVYLQNALSKPVSTLSLINILLIDCTGPCLHSSSVSLTLTLVNLRAVQAPERTIKNN